MARTPEQLAELTEKLKEGYARGMSLKQLERIHGVAASYAARLLKRAGVTMRGPANINPVRHEGWGGLNREQKRLYEDRLRGKRYDD